MDEKISLQAIEVYSESYAEKLVRGFFLKKERITGQEILSFSNIQQVNLFIIKELFKSWKDETEKVKSPYFDYDNPEVKEAFESLMNLLSKNISISAEHFKPLVKRAVSQALLAIFDPYDFYSMIITGKNNRLVAATFREDIKYLKVNKAPLERMLQKLEERNVAELSGNEAFSVLDQILEEVNFTPEDVEGYIEKFSIVAPLDPNSFFIAKNEPVVLMNDPIPPKHVNQEPRENIREAKPERPNATNNSSSGTVSSLHEKHRVENRQTLAENFQKIKKIKESLTINQKFMFTKVLFHGDFELFSRAVDRIDQFDNLNSALRYIEEEHATTWDRESEEFHEFMELVEKRFT